jgi:hypothetical protein
MTESPYKALSSRAPSNDEILLELQWAEKTDPVSQSDALLEFVEQSVSFGLCDAESISQLGKLFEDCPLDTACWADVLSLELFPFLVTLLCSADPVVSSEAVCSCLITVLHAAMRSSVGPCTLTDIRCTESLEFLCAEFDPCWACPDQVNVLIAIIGLTEPVIANVFSHVFRLLDKPPNYEQLFGPLCQAISGHLQQRSLIEPSGSPFPASVWFYRFFLQWVSQFQRDAEFDLGSLTIEVVLELMEQCENHKIAKVITLFDPLLFANWLLMAYHEFTCHRKIRTFKLFRGSIECVWCDLMPADLARIFDIWRHTIYEFLEDSSCARQDALGVLVCFLSKGIAVTEDLGQIAQFLEDYNESFHLRGEDTSNQREPDICREIEFLYDHFIQGSDPCPELDEFGTSKPDFDVEPIVVHGDDLETEDDLVEQLTELYSGITGNP